MLQTLIIVARLYTLSPACSDRERFKTASCKWVLVVGELFHIAVDFDAQKSAHYSWMLVVTELVVSATQCIRSTAAWNLPRCTGKLDVFFRANQNFNFPQIENQFRTE